MSPSQQGQQIQTTPQFSPASTSTHTVPAEMRIELAVIQEIREEGSTSDHNQEAGTGQSSKDAELSKWMAIELLKVAPFSTVCCVHSQ